MEKQNSEEITARAKTALGDLAERFLPAADWARVNRNLAELDRAVRLNNRAAIATLTLKLGEAGQYRVVPTWLDKTGKAEPPRGSGPNLVPASSPTRELINRTLHSLSELPPHRSHDSSLPDDHS